ncbi:MAG: hypothetical protein LKI39_02635 [Bacteroides sp.]|jgi:hypothetical protein|nr:hypothetical protein [Bacteroides sp.]
MELNDIVRVTLTEYGAKVLNKKNKKLNDEYPYIGFRSNYKKGDVKKGQLWSVLNNFSYDAGGEVPFTNLEKE